MRSRFQPRPNLSLPPPSVAPCDGGESPTARRRRAGRDPAERFSDYLIVERGASLGTRKRYAHAIKKLKAWARYKRKSLTQLTERDCRRWRLHQLMEGLSPSTVNTNLIALRMFFRFLMLERVVEDNPFDLVELVPRRPPSGRYLTEEEVERLFAVPDTSTYYGLLDRAMLELLYSSGLRPTEVATLRVGDVDLNRRRITCVGKGRKQRIVPVGRNAARWLKKYLTVRMQSDGGRRTHVFFAKEDGSRLSYSYVWRHVKAHGVVAGLHDLSPSILRHTCATHMHEGGAGVVHVQKLLGHSSEESTKTYTHASAKHLRRVYDERHPRATFERRVRDTYSGRRKRRAKEAGDNGAVSEG